MGDLGIVLTVLALAGYALLGLLSVVLDRPERGGRR